MLKSISKITGLGVFSNYSAAANLPEFGRYNIIYGPNGAGKTTLSRVLGVFQDGNVNAFPGLKYSFLHNTDTIKEGQPCPSKIRVFNADFIEANIGQIDKAIPHILVIGEGNRVASEQIRQDERIQSERLQEITATQTKIDKLTSQRGKIFTEIAKTISEATSGSAVRNYRKNNAESSFSGNEAKILLQEDDLNSTRSVVHQDQMPLLNPTSHALQQKGGDEKLLQEYTTTLGALTTDVTRKNSHTKAIQRLVQNTDIARWVESGKDIHKTHNSSHCEYCEQTIPQKRLDEIEQHFNEEDQKIKAEIEDLIEKCDSIVSACDIWTLPSKLEFYTELRDHFESHSEKFMSLKMIFSSEISAIKEILLDKLTRRTESYDTTVKVDIESLFNTARQIQSIIDTHNTKTHEFEAAKRGAAAKIESHYLATVVDEVREIDLELETLTLKRGHLINGHDSLADPRGVQDISNGIQALKAQVLNAHQAGLELTEKLRTFLGRADLTFESTAEGYRVHRRGILADRLSEGERSAIAFLYFVVQLGDQEFDLDDGIVVVDDPVSSLDSSSVYQAFSFLKNAVKQAKQVFLLTHNFEFLKLLINWLHNVPNRTGSKSYYMIVCKTVAEERKSELVQLDKLLREHRTEYHFLFKTLYNFTSDGTIANCYHIPNISRKLLETFLDFYSPSGESFYRKMEALAFDETKKSAIYKFANDLSHPTADGFDPALVDETQKNVGHILEMIEALAPVHYSGLVNLARA